jgi:hypothetical protein
VTQNVKDPEDRFRFADWPRERARYLFWACLGLGLFLVATMPLNPGNLSFMDFTSPIVFFIWAGVNYRDWRKKNG